MITILALTALIFILVWFVNRDARPWGKEDYQEMADIIVRAIFYVFVFLVACDYIIRNMP